MPHPALALNGSQSQGKKQIKSTAYTYVISIGAWKIHEYEVMAVARHSETLEAVVVYRPLYNDSGWWVRPYAMFVERVVIDGVEQPRFAWVG